MLFRTPKQVTRPIRDLCERVVPGNSAPIFLDIAPRRDGLHNECFDTVAAHIREWGGRVQHGWAIWEWSNTMIEAEFHAVWRAADGSLLDVTPRTDTESKILFLPDPSRTFQGVAVDNVRIPLREDPKIHEFISLAAKKYEVLNRGDRAFQFGAVSIPKHEIAPLLKRMVELQMDLSRLTAGRNDPCSCGSGKKFKKCHGSN